MAKLPLTSKKECSSFFPFNAQNLLSNEYCARCIWMHNNFVLRFWGRCSSLEKKFEILRASTLYTTVVVASLWQKNCTVEERVFLVPPLFVFLPPDIEFFTPRSSSRKGQQTFRLGSIFHLHKGRTQRDALFFLVSHPSREKKWNQDVFLSFIRARTIKSISLPKLVFPLPISTIFQLRRDWLLMEIFLN